VCYSGKFLKSGIRPEKVWKFVFKIAWETLRIYASSFTDRLILILFTNSSFDSNPSCCRTIATICLLCFVDQDDAAALAVGDFSVQKDRIRAWMDFLADQPRPAQVRSYFLTRGVAVLSSTRRRLGWEF